MQLRGRYEGLAEISGEDLGDLLQRLSNALTRMVVMVAGLRGQFPTMLAFVFHNLSVVTNTVIS